MKVVKEYNEDLTAITSRVIYSSVEEFEKSLQVALWAAEQPNTVIEIWQGGGFYSLKFNRLQADDTSGGSKGEL